MEPRIRRTLPLRSEAEVVTTRSAEFENLIYLYAEEVPVTDARVATSSFAARHSRSHSLRMTIIEDAAVYEWTRHRLLENTATRHSQQG